MARKYTGNSDGVSRTGKARPGLVTFLRLCQRRWLFRNFGTFSNRPMNNPKAIPGDPKWLSVHATGRAVDLGYSNRKKAVEAWDWFIKYTKELGIEEIHDYAFDPNPKDKEPGWGRGYRCSRGEGEKGVVVYDAKNNAGSRGGNWLHVELSPEMADNPAKMQAAWKALPKPGK